MFRSEFKRGCMLVLGGARSGKSRFALEVCNSWEGERLFLATAEALDPEMEARIQRHRLERGREWRTVEVPFELTEVIEANDRPDSVILLDCLTLWLNNIYRRFENDPSAIEERVVKLVERLSGIQGVLVAVSNEIGMGIVPADALSRAYRDALGFLNQQVARVSRKVVVLVSGLPLVLKDE